MTVSKWTLETTETFHSRLLEIESAITVLMMNILESQAPSEARADRPTDEVIYLTTQHIFSEMKALESRSYDHQCDTPGNGDLPLILMSARAHLENLYDSFDELNWKSHLNDKFFCGTLSMVLRMIEKANQEVDKAHAANFKKAA